jgi:multidrug efflux pump subunit AcrB
LKSVKASATIFNPSDTLRYFASFIFYGTNFNIMTLGAIAALGLIIDDAIVVVEQIHRTHEEHPEELRQHYYKSNCYLFPW